MIEEKNAALHGGERGIAARIACEHRHRFHRNAEPLDPGGAIEHAVLTRTQEKIADLGAGEAMARFECLDDAGPGEVGLAGGEVDDDHEAALARSRKESKVGVCTSREA